MMSEGNGNGHGCALPAPVERETQAQVLERAILETHGMIHALATDVSLVREEVRRIAQHCALRSCAPPPPPPRPPADSYSDLPSERTSPGGHMVLTGEQFEAALERRVAIILANRETQTDATAWRNLSSRLRGLVWALVASAIAGAAAVVARWRHWM